MKRVLLLLVVACGGGQTKSTVSNAGGNAVAGGDPASCTKVADHILDLMSADAKDAPPEELKKQHDLFAKHCEDDLWSADLRKCLVGVHDRKDGDRCDPLITEAQKAAFEKDLGAQQPSKDAPTGAAPASKEEPKTRGPAKKSGDPCEGGE